MTFDGQLRGLQVWHLKYTDTGKTSIVPAFCPWFCLVALKKLRRKALEE